MRIAIEASTWINLRGYGRFTRELTRALLRARSAHAFTLVLDSGAAAAPDVPDAAKVVVPTRRSVVNAASAAGARSLVDLSRMSRALSSTEFDAVVFPTLYSFVPIWSRAHVTVVIHDALPETMPNLVLGSRRARLLWRLKSRLACWQGDLLATVSQAAAREIRANLPIGTRPLVTLTEGFSSIFSPAVTPEDQQLVRARVPHPGRIILYVGGLSPHKRVPDLIRAFGNMAAHREARDLVLVLAGPDARDGFTSDLTEIDHAIAELGSLADRVVRTGFVPDPTLAALYRAARCLVLPSAAEGFGLPAIEAMASGTPVVVTRTGALEEVCGDAAQYVNTVDDLAPAIARLVDDNQHRERLRMAGLQRAQLFGWDESARRLIQALEGASTRRVGILPQPARRSAGSLPIES